MFKPGQFNKLLAHLLADSAHALHGGRALSVVLARLLGGRGGDGGLDGILKALIEHTRNHLVRELVDDGEDDGVGDGDRQLASLGREADENTGCQNDEKRSHVEGH